MSEVDTAKDVPVFEAKQYFLNSKGEVVELPQPLTTWELWRGDRLIASGRSGDKWWFIQR